ncbi:putative Late embryogenesis abundant protein [Helianthus annuus]|nr:putative Late embryogenesis abundant protein [Helianthus annuus]
MQSEIDTNSLNGCTSTSSASPKCDYIVQSPSRDSHDDKSSTNSRHTTPADSPSHSRMSSESRVSGPYRLFSINNNKEEKKALCSVIDEENVEDYYGDDDYYYDGDDDDRQVTRQCRVVMVIMGFVLVFMFVCLVTWGISRPYKLQVQMKSWKLNNFYYGEGSDYTGVPTKLLTINCSVKMNLQNPATFFGIHVSSRPLNLFYSQISVGSGQFMNFYQPKKSERTISVNVEGRKVPLYGVGDGFIMSSDIGSVPLRLEFEVRSQAYLVGPFVKTMHRCKIACTMIIDSQNNKVNDFNENSCSYN